MPHVVFIHLDLGIGGAESLVLNLAKATLPPQNDTNDHHPPGTISIYTTHCSPTHCYEEVKPPNGRLSSSVHVRGSWIPRNFSLGGTALCSSLRMLYLTYCAVKENPDANVFVLDVLPTGIPYLIGRNVSAGVLFYCHFPDKLLTRDTVNGEFVQSTALPSGVMQRLKRTYRWCLDGIEEWTMGFSDLIVVNSKFTMGEVQKVFPSLFLPRDDSEVERVKVLYPAIESSLSKSSNNNSPNGSTDSRAAGPIVSLNRFERKKNISLLLHAYDLLLEKSQNNKQIKLPPLIIAGGYDPLNIENVEHLAELRKLADEILSRYNLPPSQVISSSKQSKESSPNTCIAFYPSISNEKRQHLLSTAQVWCYTPHREHFGIVPLEAMDAGVPIVAINSGGPMETIVHGETGYLVQYAPIDGDVRENSTVVGFADSIARILGDTEKARVMGSNGQNRVHELFGMETFRKEWWELLNEVQKRGKERCLRETLSYPRLIHTIIWCLFELIVVFLFAVVLTWVLKGLGLVEEEKGIWGTVRFHYLKLIGSEEL